MSFLQRVRNRVAQAQAEVREKANQKEVENRTNKIVEEIIRRKTSAIERQERIKQAERITRERIKQQAQEKIEGFKRKDDSRQRGFEMLGFGALKGHKPQPQFNAIYGGYGERQVQNIPKRLSKKERRRLRISKPPIQPQRFDVVGGGFGNSGNIDIVGMGMRRGGI